jgi:hypothetical protein
MGHVRYHKKSGIYISTIYKAMCKQHVPYELDIHVIRENISMIYDRNCNYVLHDIYEENSIYGFLPNEDLCRMAVELLRTSQIFVGFRIVKETEICSLNIFTDYFELWFEPILGTCNLCKKITNDRDVHVCGYCKMLICSCCWTNKMIRSYPLCFCRRVNICHVYEI